LLDYLIIGQGLAGTALAWHCYWRNLGFLVIDNQSPVAASRIAAGLVTPITGRRLVKTWNFETCWQEAIDLYSQVEAITGVSFFQRLRTIRFFDNPQEAATFSRRRASGEYTNLVQDEPPSICSDRYLSRWGCMEQVGGKLDCNVYLNTSRDFFAAQSSYLMADVKLHEEIQVVDGHVLLPQRGIKAHRLVFCQGAVENPWFADFPFKPAKGEILTLRIPGLDEGRVMQRKIWLTQCGTKKKDLYHVGATYNWQDLDPQPTAGGRKEIEERLVDFLRFPYEVVDHRAAIRPIHRNQYPVIGIHPQYDQLRFLNGLGSKGALYAPYYAQRVMSLALPGGSTISL
jgi:glycine/D-amino acid oxidase-like deaminating enzyme